MALPTNLAGMFGGLSGGHGGVYFQQTGGAVGAVAPQLSGEPDVMMISGLNAPEAVAPPPGVSVVGGIAQQAPGLGAELQQPVTLFGKTLPLWNWLIIAALLGGAGGYYLGRR